MDSRTVALATLQGQSSTTYWGQPTNKKDQLKTVNTEEVEISTTTSYSENMSWHLRGTTVLAMYNSVNNVLNGSNYVCVNVYFVYYFILLMIICEP